MPLLSTPTASAHKSGSPVAVPLVLSPMQQLATCIIRDNNDFGKAIKNYPAFAAAFAGVVKMTSEQRSPVKIMKYLAQTNLRFVDTFDFHCLSEQSLLPSTLKDALQLIDPDIVQLCPDLKTFFDFISSLNDFIEALRAQQALHDCQQNEAKEHNAEALRQAKEKEEDVEMSAPLIRFTKQKADT
ncbi:hypothetical protein C0991_011325, partial [Blastosporella zonata]